MAGNQNNVAGMPASKWASCLQRWMIGALVVGVALAAALAGFEYVASTPSALAGVCGQLSFTRHGLPCDIPLPSGANLVRTSSATTPDAGATTVWKFHLTQPWNKTRDDIQRGLGEHGWPCVVVRNVEGLYLVGTRKADRPGQVVMIEVEVASATSPDITIALFQRMPVPPFLTCS